MFDNKDIIKLYKAIGHDKVLIIGIDISKYFHVVYGINGYGEEIIKPFEMDIFEKGFKLFKETVDKTVVANGFHQTIIGCEPTGHYNQNLMNNLQIAYPNAILQLVNPMTVKAARDEAMFRSKTDNISCMLIANLLKNGNGYPYISQEAVYRDIKEYVRYLDRSTKEAARIKNQLHGYLDEIYPGLESHFHSFSETQFGISFIKTMPDPLDLKEMTLDELVQMFNKFGYKIKLSKAEEFSAAVKELLIVQRSETKAKMILAKQLAIALIQYEQGMKEIEVEMEKCLNQLKYLDNLYEIKGIGVRTLGRFVAYLGNPLNFKTGAQVVSFAGLVSPQDQSGERNVEGKAISRIGHRKLRSTLIQSAQCAATNMGYFTAFYNHLVIDNHKLPDVAIVAVAAKLARVMMHMIHTGEHFNPPTAMSMDAAIAKSKRITKKHLRAQRQKRRQPKSLTQEDNMVFITRV